jgi:hypothetical protein
MNVSVPSISFVALWVIEFPARTVTIRGPVETEVSALFQARLNLCKAFGDFRVQSILKAWVS